MSKYSPPVDKNDNRAILHNKLTVGDAKHMLRNEGGPMTPMGAAIQIITVLAVSAFTARAIQKGQATVWHLFLPMLAEYLFLLMTMPVLAIFLPDPELRRDSRRGAYWLLSLAIGVAVWITMQASKLEQPWMDQGRAEIGRFLGWIVDHQMHWPILAAVAGRAANLPGRIAAFHRYGPPFVPVGLGCAMRLGLMVLAAFAIPWLFAAKAESTFPVVWVVWGIVLLAEALAIWMHLDIQMRLKKRGIEL